MKKISIVFLFLIFLLLPSCGLLVDSVVPMGDRTIEDYSAAHFNKIAVSGSISLKIVNGEDRQVEIETFENVHDYIETSVFGNELTIKTRNNTIFTKNPDIMVYVTADLINGVSTSGSSDLYFVNYETDDITIKSSGSSDIFGELTASSISFNTSGSSETDLVIDCKNLTGKDSGSSHYKLEGKTENYDLTCSGSSKVEAFELNTVNTNIKASGSVKVDISVSESLHTHVSGSGHIRYKGEPNTLQNVISGFSGKVEKVD